MHSIDCAQDEALTTFFSEKIADPLLQQPVTAVRLVRDANTGVGKGFAFVEFQTKAAAQQALMLDGQDLAGRRLRIMRVTAAGTPGSTAKPKGTRDTAPRARKHDTHIAGAAILNELKRSQRHVSWRC